MLEQIVPDVFTWHWFSEKHGYDFNGYLVVSPGGNIAIDPVEIPPPVMSELVEKGVATIVLTNRNHTRDSARLRLQTGAKIVIHRADADHAKAQGVDADTQILAGDRVGPLEVVAAPGKSPGEVALLWPERRILFVGDICVGKPPGGCALLPEAVIDDPAGLRETLARIAAEVEFETLLCGDGTPILQGGRAALRALVETF